MRDQFLSAALSVAKDLNRDEPEVAANIGIQLEHMGLETWSISVRRRIRDSMNYIQPKKIIQTGAGIGHLTAWLLDYFSTKNIVEKFQVVEEGNRFAVILSRLQERFSKINMQVKVGKLSLLAAEHKAWAITRDGEPPLLENADVIIVNSSLKNLADEVRMMLSHLNENGVLLTVEPVPPVGERDEEDPEVVGFNSWMELVKDTSETHHIAFAPLFGGTIVAWLKKFDMSQD
ncbi:MAG: hypothetical protein QGI21_03465 [Candidatus Poseidoniaceae archaeon]|jgi:hypothetical protein|nr:hypothetical protein [Candidatus Poseidoniaceae archaeon]